MKRQFKFRSIRQRILVGFMIIVVFVITLGAFNFYDNYRNNKMSEQIIDEELPLTILNHRYLSTMTNMVAVSRAYLLHGGEFKDIYLEEVEQMEVMYDYAKTIGITDEFQELFDKSKEWQDIIINEVFVEYDKGNVDRANEIALGTGPMVTELLAGYREIAETRENSIYDLELEVLKNGRSSLVLGAIVNTIVVIVSIALALLAASLITNPIKRVMERMSILASGDLNHEPLETNTIDEAGQLVHATNNMTENMRNLLNQINIVSESVSSQSEELTQSANEVKSGAEQISITMQELADGSETEAHGISELSALMRDFTTKVEEASNSSQYVEETSGDVLQLTDDGTNLMNSSMDQMAVIDKIVQNAVTSVEGLDRHSQEISELVSVIQDIADQTNLLALNAAIEAARAGEQGKGFAVVADEVRKLAEQSSDSVTNITGIVKRIQAESTSVVKSLREGYKDVDEGTQQIRTTGETFSEISSAIDHMINNIKTVTENMVEMAKSSHDMNNSIEEIAAITEESAAGVEETSASSEQTSSAMEEVAASSAELANLALELNDLVGQFKV